MKRHWPRSCPITLKRLTLKINYVAYTCQEANVQVLIFNLWPSDSTTWKIWPGVAKQPKWDYPGFPVALTKRSSLKRSTWPQQLKQPILCGPEFRLQNVAQPLISPTAPPPPQFNVLENDAISYFLSQCMMHSLIPRLFPACTHKVGGVLWGQGLA